MGLGCASYAGPDAPRQPAPSGPTPREDAAQPIQQGIKNGVTSTTFKTVPDQPFSTFELTLPEGPYSALAANGNLCHETKTVTVKKKETKRVHGKLKKVTVKVKKTEAEGLVMPNEFVGQNGAVIKQDTAISVTGCKATKPAKKKRAKKKAKGKKGKKK